MSTYAEVKARIATETNRSDLTAVISQAVDDAIEFFADDRLVFNEGSTTGVTVSGTETVDLPSGLRIIDEVLATVGTHRYELVKRDWDDIEKWHGASDAQGQPLDYAVRDGQIRIYPTPNAAYTITFTGIFDETALSADSDTNGWTSGLYEYLIVQRAKQLIARDITYDSEMETNALRAWDEALKRLRKRVAKLSSTLRVKPR